MSDLQSQRTLLLSGSMGLICTHSPFVLCTVHFLLIPFVESTIHRLIWQLVAFYIHSFLLEMKAGVIYTYYYEMLGRNLTCMAVGPHFCFSFPALQMLAMSVKDCLCIQLLEMPTSQPHLSSIMTKWVSQFPPSLGRTCRYCSSNSRSSKQKGMVLI